MNRLMGRLPRRIWIALGAAGVVLIALAWLRAQTRRVQPNAPAAAPALSSQQSPRGVAALGRLEPAGDVRTLAAPTGGVGMSPRLATLLVREGDAVRRGQILASFDNRPGLLAQRELLSTRVNSLMNQLAILEAQTSRYRNLTRSGANPAGDLDEREIQLTDRRGRLNEARAELKRLKTDLELSELRSPIDGVVLRVFTQPGERPDASGILEVGANQRMEAIAEVYESDVARIRIGQMVLLESESGGFRGTLRARVLRISPQVRQRQVLSTDPSADADARIVEVRLGLDPDELPKVAALAGLKVIARFQP